MRMKNSTSPDLELQIELLLEINEDLILAMQNMRTQLMGLPVSGLGRAERNNYSEAEFNRLYPDSIW